MFIRYSLKFLLFLKLNYRNYFFQFSSGSRYQGEFFKGYRHGAGQLFRPDGDISYSGDFQKNKKTGKGIIHFKSGHRYEGDVVDGQRHGTGSYFWNDSFSYKMINHETENY